jgi:hypothetical protein
VAFDDDDGVVPFFWTVSILLFAVDLIVVFVVDLDEDEEKNPFFHPPAAASGSDLA